MSISYKFNKLQWESVWHPHSQTYSWENLTANRQHPFQPLIWRRFIDSIFMVWTQGEKNLKLSLDI